MYKTLMAMEGPAVSVKLDDSLRQRLKVQAAIRDTTIKDLLAAILRERLSQMETQQA